MKSVVLIVLLIIVIAFSGNITTVSAEFLEAGVKKIEKPIDAPDFTLKALDRNEISLKELRGRVILLNFSHPYCSVCEKQILSLDKLGKEIKNKDLVILSVAIEGKEKDLFEFKNRHHISLPILIDEGGIVAKTYQVMGHPETFFINRKGKIVGKTFSVEDWTSKNMKRLIESLLLQKK
jgi:peroxiredoxin